LGDSRTSAEAADIHRECQRLTNYQAVKEVVGMTAIGVGRSTIR
jgi:hypothetical protein